MSRVPHVSRLTPDRDGIPDELKAVPQWVLWRAIQRDGRIAKQPRQANGRPASVSDPGTWQAFDEVWDAYAQSPGSFNGIGFVLSEDTPYAGVDLDAIYDSETGELDGAMVEEVDALQSYSEFSVSGTGAHVVFKLSDKAAFKGGYRNGRIELYTRDRFFTVTGRPFADSPLPIAERQTEAAAFVRRHFEQANPDPGPAHEGQDGLGAALTDEDVALMERARNAANGAKFLALWEGILSSPHYDRPYRSRSEVRFALLSMLSYWTVGDPGQMRRLYMASPLYDAATPSNRSRDERLLDREITKIVGGMSHEAQQPSNSERMVTARQLMELDLPERRVFVPGLLGEGLTVLAGAPKAGKTRLSTRLALAVALGRSFLGKEAQPPIKTLFLALEDSAARMRDRLREMEPDEEPTDNLMLLFNRPSDEKLERILAQRPDVGLVIIDTLGRFHPRRGQRSPYTEDYDVASGIAELARHRHIAILCLHHTRKGLDTDPIEAVSGTFGLTGGADTILHLSRPQPNGPPVLKVRSRDFEEGDLLIVEDKGAPCFREAPTEALNPVRSAILSVLSPTQSPLSPMELLRRMPKGLCTLSNLKYFLRKLLTEGAIQRMTYGRYAHPLWSAPPTGGAQSASQPNLQAVSTVSSTSPQVGCPDSLSSTTSSPTAVSTDSTTSSDSASSATPPVSPTPPPVETEDTELTAADDAGCRDSRARGVSFPGSVMQSTDGKRRVRVCRRPGYKAFHQDPDVANS